MATTVGNDARTNVIYAVDRLREKFPNPVPFDELISYILSEGQRSNPESQALIKRFLEVNPKVTYDPAANTYRFRPLHDIASGEDLLGYFQNQSTAMGLQVRELKDGWAGAEETIDALEKENKLLVTRNKKDGHARMVWPNDPSLVAPIDQEFKDLWSAISLPASHEDIIKELTRMNHTPTGQLVKPEVGPKVEKKKRKQRSGVKKTNTHMDGLLKDYSSKRPQAAK